MTGIFISYRRADSEHAAGRLADAVIGEFGRDQVFMDVDMEPGVDFVNQIQRALTKSVVMLVVVGDNWLTAADSQGRRRLEKPDDYVRIEIATALQQEDVRVIPLLVGRAEMPSSDELPNDLAPLARRNAIELRHANWHQDVKRLVQKLQLLLEPSAKSGHGDFEPEPSARDEVAPPVPADESERRPQSVSLGERKAEAPTPSSANAPRRDEAEAPSREQSKHEWMAAEGQSRTAVAAATGPARETGASAGSRRDPHGEVVRSHSWLSRRLAPLTWIQRIVAAALGVLAVACLVFVVIMLIMIPDAGSEDSGLQAGLAAAGFFVGTGVALFCGFLLRRWGRRAPSP